MEKFLRTKYPVDIELLTKEANRMRDYAVPYCEHESPGWRMAKWTDADGTNPLPKEIEEYITKIATDMGFHGKAKYSPRIYYLLKGSSSFNHVDQATTAALNFILNTDGHKEKVGVRFGGEYGGTDGDEFISYSQGLLNTTQIHGINNVTEEERVTFKLSFFETPFEEICKMIPDEHKDVVQAVPLEAESTEAEAANRTIDRRDQDFEQAEVKDRLGIDKGIPEKTAWVITEENKKPEEKQEEKKQNEPRNPFAEESVPIHAFYTNDKRSKLRFILKHPDGPDGQPGPAENHDIDNSGHHHDAWFWVHKILGKDAISKATNEQIDRINRLRKKGEAAAKDSRHKDEQEELFQAKIAAFEMDVIRNSKNREVKSKIRRSKTMLELNGYVGAAIAMEMMNGETTD